MRFNHKLLVGAMLWLALLLACDITVDLGPAPDQGGGAPPEATTPGADEPSPDGDWETVTVARVIDGDTIELTDGRKVRYIGINTPERNQPYYQEAATMNRKLVGGKEVQLEFDVETFDKYGRTLAYVWAGDTMANLEIVRQGFANAYTVPPTVRYEAEFRAAEQEAREAERGLWAGADVALKIVHIEANAPGSDRENPNGEWIEIANQAKKPISMANFTLKDEANHIYTFGNFTVEPGRSFRLFSGQGRDTKTRLYWGVSNESIWNNGSDTAFLRNAKGELVDVFSY